MEPTIDKSLGLKSTLSLCLQYFSIFTDIFRLAICCYKHYRYNWACYMMLQALLMEFACYILLQALLIELGCYMLLWAVPMELVCFMLLQAVTIESSSYMLFQTFLIELGCMLFSCINRISLLHTVTGITNKFGYYMLL